MPRVGASKNAQNAAEALPNYFTTTKSTLEQQKKKKAEKEEKARKQQRRAEMRERAERDGEERKLLEQRERREGERKHARIPLLTALIEHTPEALKLWPFWSEAPPEVHDAPELLQLKPKKRGRCGCSSTRAINVALGLSLLCLLLLHSALLPAPLGQLQPKLLELGYGLRYEALTMHAAALIYSVAFGDHRIAAETLAAQAALPSGTGGWIINTRPAAALLLATAGHGLSVLRWRGVAAEVEQQLRKFVDAAGGKYTPSETLRPLSSLTAVPQLFSGGLLPNFLRGVNVTYGVEMVNFDDLDRATADLLGIAGQKTAMDPQGLHGLDQNGLPRHGKLFMDIYQPLQRGTSQFGNGRQRSDLMPCVLFIHGGAWLLGERSLAGLILKAELARRDMVVFAMSYRTAGPLLGVVGDGDRWPAQADDVHVATQWIRLLGQRVASRELWNEFSFDSNRLAIVGQSAGGQLAGWAATDWDADQPATGVDGDARKHQNIQAALLYYPVTDLRPQEPFCARLPTWLQSVEKNLFSSPLLYPDSETRPAGGVSLLSWLFQRFVLSARTVNRHEVTNCGFQRGCGQSIRSSRLNHAYELNRASPLETLERAPPGLRFPPTLVVHGDSDATVPHGMGKIYVDALQLYRREGKEEDYWSKDALVTVRGASHSFDLFLTPEVLAVTEGAASWLEARLKYQGENSKGQPHHTTDEEMRRYKRQKQSLNSGYVHMRPGINPKVEGPFVYSDGELIANSMPARKPEKTRQHVRANRPFSALAFGEPVLNLHDQAVLSQRDASEHSATGPRQRKRLFP